MGYLAVFFVQLIPLTSSSKLVPGSSRLVFNFNEIIY